MDHDDSARARCDRAFECVKINLPTVVVDERVAHKPHVVDITQEIKQRIAGSGNQQLVTGVAKEAEKQSEYASLVLVVRNMSSIGTVPPSAR